MPFSISQAVGKSGQYSAGDGACCKCAQFLLVINTEALLHPALKRMGNHGIALHQAVRFFPGNAFFHQGQQHRLGKNQTIP